MSRWSDKAKQHPIYDTVFKARGLVNIDIEDISSDHEEERRRFLKVLDKIDDLLNGIDLDLFPEGEFNSINNHIKHQNCWSHLIAYASNQNIKNLMAANDQMSSIIPRMYVISSMAKSPEARNEIRKVEESFGKFCKIVELKKDEYLKTFSSINNGLNKLQEKCENVDQEFNDLQKEVLSHLEDWKNKFFAEQANQQSDYAESKSNMKKEFDSYLIDFKKESSEKTKNIIKEHDDNFKESLKKFDENIENKTQDVNKKHKSILDIHGLVATDGVAGGYKKNADDEKESADNWRKISLALYLMIFAWIILKQFLGYEFYSNNEFQWPIIVMALSVTGISFVAAQFASRQSRIHRINEQRMRWFSLEVKAIDPFISSLPLEHQHVLKRQLSEKLFGQDRVADEKTQDSSQLISVDNLTDILTKILKKDN